MSFCIDLSSVICTCFQSWTEAKGKVERGTGELMEALKKDYLYFFISNDSSETSKLAAIPSKLHNTFHTVGFLHSVVTNESQYKELVRCFCESKPSIVMFNYSIIILIFNVHGI